MKPLSTGDVARITRCSMQMVIRWTNSGQLKCWRVPGSRFRRIEVHDLRDFMVRHGLPLEYLEQFARHILLVSEDKELQRCAAELSVTGRKVVCVGSFEAGMKFRELDPSAVVIDWSLGDSLARRLADTIGKMKSDCPIVALTSTVPAEQLPIPAVSHGELGQLETILGLD